MPFTLITSIGGSMSMRLQDVPEGVRERWLRLLLAQEYTWVPGAGSGYSAGSVPTSCVGNLLVFDVIHKMEDFSSQVGFDPTGVYVEGSHEPHYSGCDISGPHEHSVAQWNDNYGLDFFAAALRFATAWGLDWHDYLPEGADVPRADRKFVYASGMNPIPRTWLFTDDEIEEFFSDMEAAIEAADPEPAEEQAEEQDEVVVEGMAVIPVTGLNSD